jgi:hypothetical protein
MFRPWITVSLGVVLAGCSGKAAEPLPKFPDAIAYCTGRAQAECSDSVIAACAAPSKEKCVASRQAVCNANVPSGKSYDSSKAENCINQVSAAHGDAKLTKDEIKVYSDACSVLFSGTGVKDSSCAADGDCKQSDGLRCVLSALGGTDGGSGGVSGSCQTPKSALGGDSCSAADVNCAAGYHCGVSKHCDINGSLGEPCNGGLPCKETLKCSAAGTCEAKIADGSPCTTGDECANGICLEGSSICVSQVVFAPNEPFCVQAR